MPRRFHGDPDGTHPEIDAPIVTVIDGNMWTAVRRASAFRPLVLARLIDGVSLSEVLPAGHEVEIVEVTVARDGNGAVISWEERPGGQVRTVVGTRVVTED